MVIFYCPVYTVINIIKILAFEDPHLVATVRIYLLICHIFGVFHSQKVYFSKGHLEKT